MPCIPKARIDISSSGRQNKGKYFSQPLPSEKTRFESFHLDPSIRKNKNYMKKKLKLPKFKNEDAERAFWSRIKLSDYFEPSDFVSVSFPNLKPSSSPISIRIPSPLLFRLKEQANELGIPYQALIKKYLADKVKTEG